MSPPASTTIITESTAAAISTIISIYFEDCNGAQTVAAVTTSASTDAGTGDGCNRSTIGRATSAASAASTDHDTDDGRDRSTASSVLRPTLTPPSSTAVDRGRTAVSIYLKPQLNSNDGVYSGCDTWAVVAPFSPSIWTPLRPNFR